MSMYGNGLVPWDVVVLLVSDAQNADFIEFKQW